MRIGSEGGQPVTVSMDGPGVDDPGQSASGKDDIGDTDWSTMSVFRVTGISPFTPEGYDTGKLVFLR